MLLNIAFLFLKALFCNEYLSFLHLLNVAGLEARFKPTESVNEPAVQTKDMKITAQDLLSLSFT